MVFLSFSANCVTKLKNYCGQGRYDMIISTLTCDLVYNNPAIYNLSKVKVKIFLCLIKHHAMKTWETGGIAQCILNLSTR
jgi:hypothetical protein